MLYKLDSQKESNQTLRPVPFQDLSAIQGLEKDLETVLADNLLDLLFEDERLLPIFRERPRQAEADLYALNEEGDLFIFELKRGVAGEDAVQQLLRYTQDAGHWTFNELAEKYQSFAKKNGISDPDLEAAHQEAFNLERPLLPTQFNRKQHLRVIGNAVDEQLMNAVDYWKRQGLSIDFLPYRIYEIQGEYYFEFFSPPYDWHRNPSDIKGVIFDTNASWNEESVWEMMEKERVAAYRDAKRFAEYVQPKDIVFFSHRGRGIIAAAQVISPTKSVGYESGRLYQKGGDLMEKAKMIDDTEIRISGIEDLNKALGPAAALRFLTLLHREPTDYVEISRRLYEGQTIDEIFDRAKKHWKE